MQPINITSHPIASAALALAITTSTESASLSASDPSREYRGINAALDATASHEFHVDAIVRSLVESWQREIRHHSSTSLMRRSRYYQELRDLGAGIVPALLDLYRSNSGFLYLLLQDITGANPVPEASRGNIELIRRAWLRWGAQYALATRSDVLQ